MKLILGTAQLGLSYGITNETGLLSDEKSLTLLNHAVKNNITMFDTARAYGKSEYLLGKIKNIRIMTKLQLPTNVNQLSDSEIIIEIDNSVQESLKNLNRSTLDILLLHKWEHYQLKNKVIWTYLITLKNTGILKKIGISVYNVEEAKILLRDNNVDVIQIPFNILDNQWFDTEFQEMLKNNKDINVYCRSIYLQGILISDENKWPKIGIDPKKYVNKLTDLKNKYSFKNKKELMVSYVKSFDWISGLIIGVDNIEQLTENIELFKVRKLSNNDIIYIQNCFSDVPKRIINPMLWYIKS